MIGPQLWFVAGGIFAAIALLWCVSWLLFGRLGGVKFRPGYLTLVVGLRGGGKSLFVARLIAERLSKDVQVVANFTVSDPRAIRMRDWEDVILAPYGSMVVLDEASVWAGARAGSSLRPAAMFYVSQSRKLGHEVWIISQHENQIAGGVRDQANEIVSCEKWGFGWHRAKSFAPHEFRKKDAKTIWAWWYRPNGRAIEVYDTLDLVAPERSNRRMNHDDDIDMIERAIAEVSSRRTGPSVDEQVSAWLESAAGVPAATDDLPRQGQASEFGSW